MKFGKNMCLDGKFPKNNIKISVWEILCYFLKLYCCIVYKQWETIEKQWKQWKFENNILQLIGTISLSPQTKFGVIIITIAHLILDFIYCIYKGNI